MGLVCIAASKISALRGMISEEQVQDIKNTFEAFEMPVTVSGLDWKDVYATPARTKTAIRKKNSCFSWSIPKAAPLAVCLMLIASGAVGNMIDRITLSYVVDFLYFSLINFPIFNVADCYVTCSAVGLVLLIMFYYKDEDMALFSFKKNGLTVHLQ